MSWLVPFKAGYYNSQKVSRIDNCLSFPFDEIDPDEVEQLQKNPYHYSHVILTKLGDQESYVLSKHKLFGWFIRDVIVFDKVPSVYIYDQPFIGQGVMTRRLSLMALVSLEEIAKRLYFYENLREEYVEDCYQRIVSSQCSLEPVLLGYYNASLRFSDLASRAISQGAFLSFGEKGEKEHRLYQISEPSLIEHIQVSLQNEKMFLLDGHHRLKAALRYQQEQKMAKGNNYTGKEPWNYVLVNIINMGDSGFSILPYNRLLKMVSLTPQDMMKQIGVSWKLAVIPFQDALTEKAARKKLRILLNDYQAKKVVAFGIALAQVSMKYFLAVGGSGFSPEVVDTQVIQNILGVTPQYPQVYYDSDDTTTLDRVKNKMYQVAFLSQALSLQEFLQLNPNQLYTPRSFTFYPKVPSGVILYSFKYSF